LKTNWTRFVAAFDVHGDHQDKQANDALFKFLKLWKPQLRIFGGDLWDFRPLRRKANEDERRESMRADYDAGIRWLKQFQPHVFIRGNHDERLWDIAASNRGAESDYALNGIVEITALLKSMGCRMLPYHKRDGVFRLGHLKILHGFACGVFAARQTALIYNSCLFGHVHTIDEHSIPGLERRVARSAGCLCSLDMDYAARTPSTLRQAHGWAFGVVHKTSGHYHLWQAEKIGGRWLVPTDTVQL